MTARERKKWPPDPEPGEPVRGMCCPSCGCVQSEVTHTRQQIGKTLRYRVCRYCGRHYTTWEVAPCEVAVHVEQVIVHHVEAIIEEPEDAVIAEPRPKAKRKRKAKP